MCRMPFTVIRDDSKDVLAPSMFRNQDQDTGIRGVGTDGAGAE